MSLLYLKNIIKNIEEYSPHDDLDDNLHNLAKKVMQHFKLSKELNYVYILRLLENDDNKIVFYNLDDNRVSLTLDYCYSAIIYNIKKVKKNIICYILSLTTVPQHRKKGFAKKLIENFAIDIKEKYNQYDEIKLLLSATDESFTFYETTNFTLIDSDLIEHPILAKHEKYDSQKLYYIFERTL